MALELPDRNMTIEPCEFYPRSADAAFDKHSAYLSPERCTSQSTLMGRNSKRHLPRRGISTSTFAALASAGDRDSTLDAAFLRAPSRRSPRLGSGTPPLAHCRWRCFAMAREPRARGLQRRGFILGVGRRRTQAEPATRGEAASGGCATAVRMRPL